MLKSKLVLAAFAVLSTTSSFVLADESANATSSTCHTAQLATIRTDFPQASQSRGEHGTVIVKFEIDKDGRAINTQVSHSSGFPALDKAAAASVAQHWRFDVSHCAPSQLPTTSFVTLEFQRAAKYTLYGTLNKRRSATNNHPDTQSRCDTTRNNAGDHIVACLSDASLAGRNNQPSLANRADASQRK